MTVEWLSEVTSTNTLLKQRGIAGAPHGTALAARRQTGGRGRMGRSFCSPEGGLYMSVLLRPTAPDLNLLTVAAAVAAAEAAEGVVRRPVGIKWVNDLYLDGRKVAGILSESFADEAGDLCVVVGFGVNLVTPPGGFPEEIREIAGALLPAEAPGLRERLAEDILHRFLPYAEAAGERAFLPGYRARSLLCGREIAFFRNGIPMSGTVLGVAEDGGLRVRAPSGEETVLHSGEVTLHRD